MLEIKYINLFKVLLLFWLLSSAQGFASDVLSKELLKLAEKHDCKAFDGTGKIRQPPLEKLKPFYVYGPLGGEEKNSVAFWCKPNHPKKRTRSLLVVEALGAIPYPLLCPNGLEWFNGPKPLSLVFEATKSDFFHYATPPYDEVEKGIEFDGIGIQGEYDGTDVLFYCYKGSWVSRMRH